MAKFQRIFGRSEVEVIQEILSICENGGVTRAIIKVRSRLSLTQLGKYLNLLSKNGLIRREPVGFYHNTDTGQQMLKRTSRAIGTIHRLEQELEKGLLNPTIPEPRKQSESTREDTSTMLTVSQAAHLLGIHSNSVRRWADIGLLHCFRVGIRGDRRFRPNDIDTYLEVVAPRRSNG